MPRRCPRSFRVVLVPKGSARERAQARERVSSILRSLAADLEEQESTRGSSALDAHPPDPATGRSTRRSSP